MADDFLGLDPKVIVAGMSGGLSIVYALKKPEAWELIAGLIVGGLTANYWGPPLAYILGTPLLATAFFVGIGGKYLCVTGLAYLKSKVLSKE